MAKKRAGSIETFLRLFLYPRFTAGTKTIGQFYEYTAGNRDADYHHSPNLSPHFTFTASVSDYDEQNSVQPFSVLLTLTLAVSFKAFGTEETELGGFSDLIIDLWREEQLKDGSHWRLARKA